MNKDFPLNRFNFTNLIKHIRTEILIPNVITDDETGIEFYGGDSIPQKALIDLLKNFNIIDNLVQQSNSEEFKKQTQLDIKNFQFEPSWVKITPDNISLEDLQSYFQTLPLCLYFSAQQIEELEEQLETIRFLISDEMQHETVIHYLKPMKNYLESLRSSKIVPLIENLITGKDISIENAQHIEVLLDDYYENDEVIQDFITDLALYNPGGGEYLYSHSEITPKAKHILAYIQKNYCSDG